MSKTYLVERSEDGVHVTVQGTGLSYPLRHLVLHSPTGFDYGYLGSGPSDLALSLAADVLGEQPSPSQLKLGDSYAWRVHHAVKQQFVATLDQDVRQHEIDGDELLAFIHLALHREAQGLPQTLTEGA